MGKIIDLGEKLPLTLTLFSGATNRFVRAWVYDKSFTEISGSPYNLTHLANGLYKNDSFTPTVEEVYHVVYKVYSDSGYTNYMAVHGTREETITVSNNTQEVVDQIETFTDEITENIDSGEGRAV